MVPNSTSTASGTRNSRRSRMRSSRGRDQPAASATHEMTSTAAAAAPNSSSGIGRSALPTIPCAMTSMGGRVYERATAPPPGGAVAGRSGVTGAGQPEQRAPSIAVAVVLAGAVGLGTNVSRSWNWFSRAPGQSVTPTSRRLPDFSATLVSSR